MLDVFLTVDVELWCDGWDNIDQKFAGAFRKYIYGQSSDGNFGLPYQFEILAEYGLTGVFFVEPLFSARFGMEALNEIVGLILEAGHEVQLHLHTEWVDESVEPLIADCLKKRQHLRFYTPEEQAQLIGIGKSRLAQAGVPHISAFRAGSFGFNHHTLPACARNGIHIDSSYNASLFGLDSGVHPGEILVEPVSLNGVCEYPMTVFDDGTGKLRHAQLTACSIRELEHLLWQALNQQRKAFVLLSHSFELLNMNTGKPDRHVIKRFRQLCEFLHRHEDVFNVRGFNDLPTKTVEVQPAPLSSPVWNTVGRMVEQLYRRVRH